MIKAINLTKKYQDNEILKGINLEINQGEVVAIVGASGAGKTTLLQIMGTLDKASSGAMLFDGMDVTKLNNNKLAQFRNQNLGFIFQFHQLLPEFTALENVCFPGWIGKNNQTEKRAKELLEHFNLSHRVNHKPAELSGGEQQRVAVARALVNNPKVVFADEPSGNLDSKNADELHDLFFSLRSAFNQTFVIVTHNDKLAGMADRTLTIKDGVIEP